MSLAGKTVVRKSAQQSTRRRDISNPWPLAPLSPGVCGWCTDTCLGAVRCGEATGHSQVEATQPRPSQTRAKPPPHQSDNSCVLHRLQRSVSSSSASSLLSADLAPFSTIWPHAAQRCTLHTNRSDGSSRTHSLGTGLLCGRLAARRDLPRQVQHGAAARSTGVVAVYSRQRALAQRPPDAADLVAKALGTRSIPPKYTVYGPGQRASDGSIPTWRQDGPTTYVGETAQLRSRWQVPFSLDIEHPTRT